MVWLLRRCTKCRSYTLKRDICPRCGGAVRIPHPAKFSPDDKYLKYRLALKQQQQEREAQ
ncbi:MAG: RNA-protein complex protein Nop10 [Candidatus Bathyarchaeia archaeon]